MALVTDGPAAPVVDFVPSLQWFTFQVGVGNMLKTLILIDASGATTLNASPTTFTDVYVDTVTAGGAITITMPSIANLVEGQEWLFKDTTGAAGTNQITLAANTGYLIDGNSSFLINNNYGNILLVWNGIGFSVKL